jgi:hypothetical protein
MAINVSNDPLYVAGCDIMIYVNYYSYFNSNLLMALNVSNECSRGRL